MAKGLVILYYFFMFYLLVTLNLSIVIQIIIRTVAEATILLSNINFLTLCLHNQHELQLAKHEGSSEVVALHASLLSFQDLIYALDGTWLLSGLGHDYGIDIQAISKAAVLHYNGNMKPWLELGIPKYRGYWKKYLNRDDQFLSQCNVNS